MATATLEITTIQINYGLKIDAIENAIKTALINADYAKTQNNWSAYAHFLQLAATEAQSLATVQAASDAFDAKVGA
jgi:hypothetical protein